MATNPFAAMLAGVPRYGVNVVSAKMERHPYGVYVELDRVLAALAAAVPDDLAEAAGRLKLAWIALHGHKVANPVYGILARIAAQEAQIKGLEEAIDANWITHQRVVAAETALAAMTKERDDAMEWAKEQHGCADLYADALAAERAKVAKLVEAGNGLNGIVEGIQGAMQHGTWRDEKGQRLKDTPEWVAFYNARAAITEAGQ